MAKEDKRKVKTNALSSPKYATSDEANLSSDDDDSLPSELCKNPNAMIKELMKQVRVRDELLEQQEELFIHSRKSNEELKKLLTLGKSKVEKLDQELAQSKETTCSLKSSIGPLQDHMMSCKRYIKILNCNLILFNQAPLIQSYPKAPKATRSK
jgi:chromosome segregation ATPase